MKSEVKGLLNIFGQIKIKRPITKIIDFLKTIEYSSKKSRINFFFQMINFTLVLLLIMYILPNKIDTFISKWGEIKVFYIYFPKMGFAVLLYFISWIINQVSDLSFSIIFQTKIKLTITILISLIISLCLIYRKVITILFTKIKNDTNYTNYLIYERTK